MTTWVLLRGLARDSRHWSDFMPMLEAAHKAGARVIALDLPGNGVLQAERSPCSASQMVEAYRGQLVAQKASSPIHLLGLSLGSMVAIEWAHAYPGDIASVVLVNGSARELGLPWERLLPGSWRALAKAAMPFASPCEREQAVLSVCSNGGAALDAALMAWTQFAVEGRTRAINALRQLLAAATYQLPADKPAVPVLVALSTHDRLVSADCSVRLALRWNLPVAVHPRAGHELSLDAPHWLAQRCAQWAEGLSQNRRESAMSNS